MEFYSAYHTDVGIRKKTNQDSVLIKLADTDYGKVFFAVVCDGMGGLEKGEVASASLIRAFSEWFDKTFPEIFYEAVKKDGLGIQDLQYSWNEVIQTTNEQLHRYSSREHTSLGTTAVGVLLFEDTYYIFNVGDSRVYRVKEAFTCVTKDQTFVQREVDEGRMTPEEAKFHPQQNVLLQCVGASQVISPEFYTGGYEKDTIFVLCSDGFRHLIEPEEFYAGMNPEKLSDEKSMREAAVYYTELNKKRNEKDNITVVLVRAE